MSLQRPDVPVLILPGWKDRARALRHLVRGLVSHGWPSDFVRAIEFDDPFGSNVEHAHEIRVAVDELRRGTGARTVDVVAHSMGGLALRYYLANTTLAAPTEPPPIRRAVFLASPHHGTWAAWLAWGDGAHEMRPGSPFLNNLARHSLPADVQACCVRTRIDFHVMPGSSAILPGSRLHVLSSVTHRGLLRSPAVLRLVIRHLEDAQDTG